jgi:hypothetical protein
MTTSRPAALWATQDLVRRIWSPQGHLRIGDLPEPVLPGRCATGVGRAVVTRVR